MYAYSTPGVYFQPVNDRLRPLLQWRTDIAAFIGIAERGPLCLPVKLESWQQFVAAFGAHIPQGYLAYAVEGFFANGGLCCWVVRVADPARARPASTVLAPGYQLLASTPGDWGEKIQVSLVHTGEERFTLRLHTEDGRWELWRDLATKPCLETRGQRCEPNLRYFKSMLNDPVKGSNLVRVEDGMGDTADPREAPPLLLPRARTVGLVMENGADGLATLGVAHFQQALKALEAIDEVAIVAMPDIMPKVTVTRKVRPQTPDCTLLTADTPIYQSPVADLEFPPAFNADEIDFLQSELIAHCVNLKDRVAILDVGELVRDPQTASQWRNRFDSTYGALYYPWLAVPDPLRLTDLLRLVPPSGHIAGIYARSDQSVGVHKSPANVELVGVKDVTVATDDIGHGFLNERQVNVIRPYPGRGIRVSGARTLSRDSEWRYINVRRLVTMIEEAIDEQLQWTVFEPNDQAIWGDIERIIRNFLHRLWRQGMLDGATPEEAFQVRCDGTTNMPQEIDQGRLVCEIGLYLPWPAEFILLRLGITEGGTEIIEER